MIFGISCRETQNFWSPKQQQHRKEFRNSDPPNNKGKNSESLIPEENNEGFRITDPQRAQRRIQNFWSPKSTGKDSVFLIPQRFRISDPQQWHTKGFRICLIPYKDTQRDTESLISYKDTEKYSEFLIPQRTQEKIQNFSSTEEHGRERIQNFWSPTEQDSQLSVPKEHSLKRNQNFPLAT